ncbi:phosphoribosylglycinamide formyltransferase [Miniphocaeibacter halophilus]|uniref:Phosphoribosylglycinamide formyltransferase n=1 Tax=Miniphocaeibacter halophilus TaxID=2931922 RepID=A0AC61MWR8_9FIRM|nr:phosphoribosylglycinamide formyltransferase [Miniphocaeibacter halophilus]QQK07991.1 phosphoribosylglycinamide formyltransferase [Miniphocaeibacter halophilus]
MSLNIAVMISGSGSNLQSIIDAIEKNILKSEIKIVISNMEKAYGLVRAKKHGIDAVYLSKKDYSSLKEYEKELLEVFKNKKIDLIVLAGYLGIVPEEIIKYYKNKIVNIHPSLIPSFCGKGFYGINVHEKVLEYGVKVTGATTHFVDEGVDTGPIIIQEPLKIEEEITAEELQKRVLDIEHKILVETIRLIEDKRLEINGRKVLIRR